MKSLYAFALLLLCNAAFAQNIGIRGLIKDAVTKEPVIAVSCGRTKFRIGNHFQ